ncbi:flavin monoamine oxidase family protein [Bacillus sp. AFS055030]|uniref:flavin monoamine oxidase family protein n=1 Tax=Bacillus sp. AFS055030 TaxID=2033507 RepID=UPI000BFE9312|nr:flavin monoamine oxidase family protein [Bacillus sp. AFS055030]PGL69511.1 amine oxidase [Bacillus sp. AFS055030]
MDQMISIIRNGLPKTGAPKDIIIAGAGMAGLVSGSLLKDAGHRVTILEANDRVGGRIYTKRFPPFVNNQYVELGAMRIPSTHLLTLEYIKKFHLPINLFINSTPEDLIFVNNIHTDQKSVDKNPDILGFPVNDFEKGKTAEELLKLAIQPVIEFIKQDPEKNWDIVIGKYDKYSIDAFLRYNPVGVSLSGEAIEMIKVLIGVEGFPELSFPAVLREVMVLLTEGLKFFEITGGNEKLPNSFIGLLKDNIFYHQRVTKIIQNDSKVTIQSKNTLDQKNYEVSGDLAIITLPFSLLNFIDIIPVNSFSYKKLRAISELHYVDSMKIGLQFRSKFWEKRGTKGGKLITDLPIRFSYFPSHDIGGDGTGILLASYTWGDDAFIWNSKSEDDRIRMALNNLAKVYGFEVYEEFMGGITHSWSNYPFANGAFTMFKPEQLSDFGKAISTPEGKVHFAGAHTSTLPGWIQGAIESGVRVAFEINGL